MAQNAQATHPTCADGKSPTLAASTSPAQFDSSTGLRTLAGWLQRPLAWRHHKALAACAVELRDCAGSLSGHAAATEPEFLALGGELRTLYELSTALTQAVDEATVRLHSHLTANRIGGDDGVVAHALQSVNDSIAAIDGMLGRLRTMTDGLLSMKPQMDRIGRVGVLLQSVAVGFAVESSRTTECQQAFGSFVDEIRALSRRTREVETRISEELDRASGEELAALRSLEQELAGLRELSRNLELTSSRTAAEVQSRMNDIVAAMATMRDCSLQIQRHTEDAVFHMQFGDIVRQKIEHTVEALQTAAAELDVPDRAPLLSASAAHLPVAVQCAQLELVESELGTAQSQLAQAFSRISESSASLISPAQNASHTEHGGTVGLRPLLEDLEQLQQLVAQGGQLRRRADESGHQAFATAERIASQIREVQSINREMHLLALNAIVKTAALGTTGATLGVLSMQVHALYLEADTAVGAIDTLARQLAGAQDREEVATTGGGEPSLDLPGVVEQVRSAAADYLAATAALGEKAASNRDQFEKAKARLESLDRFSHQLRDLRARLASAGGALAQRFGPALARAQRSLSPTDDTRYTMQSEREVQRRIGAGVPAATAASSARSPRPPITSPPAANNSAPPHSRSPKAPPNRPPQPRKAPPPWRRWPPASSRTPTTPNRPTRSPARPPRTPRPAAIPSARPSAQ